VIGLSSSSTVGLFCKGLFSTLSQCEKNHSDQTIWTGVVLLDFPITAAFAALSQALLLTRLEEVDEVDTIYELVAAIAGIKGPRTALFIGIEPIPAYFITDDDVVSWCPVES